MLILVTGSSGTIGTRLCEKLLEEGYDVTAIDRRPNPWNAAVGKHTINVDLLKTEEFAKLPSKPDMVIHLAANARVYDLVEDPPRALENITTVFNVLEWVREHNIPRFIFASSREVYGNMLYSKLREDLARIENCESPYTASKFAGEALIHAYERCYGLPAVILRFSNVYGMYDDSNRVIPLFIRRAKRNESLVVYGKEKCLDFTYIDDAISGILLTLQHFTKVQGNTYNIATGGGTTIVELAQVVKKLLKSTSSIRIAEPRTGEVIRYIADISKAKKNLSYTPSITFEEGIQKTVEWYLSHTVSP